MSVVIPTYNRCADAQTAVLSVLAQDYPQELIEIIVVDDGGVDDTIPVLERRFGARLKLVRQENGGVSSARNHGARLATAELLAFLDSDDYWEPTKLTRQQPLLDQDPSFALVLTDMRFIDESGEPAGTLRRREVQYEGDSIELSRLVRYPDLDPSSTLMRTAVFRELGGFDESLPTAEDIDFTLRLAVRYRIANVDEMLTVRVLHKSSGLSNLSRTTRDFISVVERFVATNPLPPEIVHAALFATYVRNARTCMWSGEVSYGLACAARGVKHIRGRNDAAEFARVSLTMTRAFAGHVKAGIRRSLGLTRRAPSGA